MTMAQVRGLLAHVRWDLQWVSCAPNALVERKMKGHCLDLRRLRCLRHCASNALAERKMKGHYPDVRRLHDLRPLTLPGELLGQRPSPTLQTC